MDKIYNKPFLKSYSTKDILEEIGPCQNQYTNVTTTFLTTTGNSSVNVDGAIANDNTVTTDSGINAGGDSGGGQFYRGFVGYNINSIPSGSTIVSATLRIYLTATSTSIGGVFGNVIVDHIDFSSSLDIGDFGNATGSDALTANIGTIADNDTSEYKTLNVSNYVQADVTAGRTRSQYRLRVSGDTVGNYFIIGFDDAENSGSSGNRPELVVTYK